MYTVYAIKKDGVFLYIGKTNNLQRRRWEHRYIRKLDDTYIFESIFESDSKEEVKLKEEYYINLYRTFENGWNKNKGDGMKGLDPKKNKGTFKEGNNIHIKREKKKVFCLDNNKIYNSIKECSEDTGCNISGIYKVCQGKKKTCNKMRFEYI